MILLTVLFLMFQAVFSWAQPAMDGVDRGIEALAAAVHTSLPAGPLRDLLSDGVLAGVGNVVKFLPQIAILFLFILLLEDSGYMGRAGLPDGPADGGRGPARARLHPAAFLLRLRDPRHHGHARDRQPARPADHDHGGAAHDLLGAYFRSTRSSSRPSCPQDGWRGCWTCAGL